MTKIESLFPQKNAFRMRQPVDEEKIIEAENALELRFSDEYKSYLLAFGAASANGHEFTGICDSARLNVVEVTKEEWLYNSNVPHDLYVVEQTHIDGIVLWQPKTGQIYQTCPNSAPSLLYDSLCELLEK